MSTSPVRSAALAIAKRGTLARRAIRAAVKGGRWAQYRTYFNQPVQANTVLFESFSGRGYSGSPRAIYEAMIHDDRFADWTFAWAFREPFYPDELHSEFPELQSPRTRLVGYGTSRYYRLAASAHWWVTNAIMPTHMSLRPGQQQLQTWHGTPFKRLGADVIDDTFTATFDKTEIVGRYREAGELATYLLSASDFNTQTFASAFTLEDASARAKILQIGNPRNDSLIQADPQRARELREELNIPVGNRVILYAPTWRDDQHSSKLGGYTYRLDVDLEKICRDLGPGYTVLFRAHYLIASELGLDKFGPQILDVSHYPEVNDLYQASDALVTDYSSVFFDYVLLDRPIFFFMYDLDHYRDRLRGLYLDLKDLPGPVSTDEEDLCRNITATLDSADSFSAQRQAFRSQYATWDDGLAGHRVLNLFLGTSPTDPKTDNL